MKLKLFSVAALAALNLTSLAFADALTTKTIDVYSGSPLPSIGITLNKVPSNIQVIKGANVEKEPGVSIADYLMNNAQGVSMSETQGNPYQLNMNFRGYTASPFEGAPQGLSVYLDGVRVNEPFGDTVNWDLIPQFAVQSMQLVPGSNPVYGLNTLGGAISIQTKNGRTNPGGAVQFSVGSFGRSTKSAEYAGVTKDGKIDYYIADQTSNEKGWRRSSPSETNQFFTKLGWQDASTKVNVSLLDAKTKLTGNGLTPESILNKEGRDAVYTTPDRTENSLTHLTINGDHWLNDHTMLSGNTYTRFSNKQTVNGDFNDEFDSKAFFLDNDRINGAGKLVRGGVTFTETYPLTVAWKDSTGATQNLALNRNAAADVDASLVGKVCLRDDDLTGLGLEEDSCRIATMNKSYTKQRTYGFNLQASNDKDLFGKKNEIILGAAFSKSDISYRQTQQLGGPGDGKKIDGVLVVGGGWFDGNKAPTGLSGSAFSTEVNLDGKTYSSSLYLNDVMSLTPQWHLNGAVRLNHASVENVDLLNAKGSVNSLDGSYKYVRLNPMIGITYTPSDNATIYGSYSESNRAPSSIELGCANPLRPCKLPNAMASDPPLDQVVVKTYEAGARGKINDALNWSGSLYHAKNHQDIQFISASATPGRGYFDNIGTTKRQGLDLGLGGKLDEKLSWNFGYSYIEATYDSNLTLASNCVNTSKNFEGGNQFEDNSTLLNDCSIDVKKGNSLANIPKESLKLRAEYRILPNWTLGSNVVGFTKKYVEGNENQQHDSSRGIAGSTPGYAIVNLDTNIDAGKGWKVFAKVTNLFDREYITGGRLVKNHYNSDGTFSINGNDSLAVVPGAPRAGWIGVRYEFGGADKKD